jgi:U8 snoRNA-decapping enzyme
MQMRFDGKLGFPGGLIDPGEEIVAGLNRELVEEINLDLTKHAVEPTDFLFCHYLPNESDQTKSSRIRMFFSKEVTKSEYEMIEKNSLDAKEFGYEVISRILHFYFRALQ